MTKKKEKKYMFMLGERVVIPGYKYKFLGLYKTDMFIKILLKLTPIKVAMKGKVSTESNLFS